MKIVCIQTWLVVVASLKWWQTGTGRVDFDLASGCSEFEMVALGDDFACGEWL